MICRLAGRDENDDLSTVTNPILSLSFGLKGETKSILSTSAGKDRSQKKRVKFADEASSSDNESHSSLTDTAVESASGELESEAGQRPKAESLYKQVLDKTLNVEAETEQGESEGIADSTNKEEVEEVEDGKINEVTEEVKDGSEMEDKTVTPGDEVSGAEGEREMVIESQEKMMTEGEEKIVKDSEERSEFTVSEGEEKTVSENEDHEGKTEDEVKEETMGMKTDIELQAEELLFLWKDLKVKFLLQKC